MFCHGNLELDLMFTIDYEYSSTLLKKKEIKNYYKKHSTWKSEVSL